VTANETSPPLVFETGLLADYMKLMQIKLKAETRASQVSKQQQQQQQL
jgi:hypothetical protein